MFYGDDKMAKLLIKKKRIILIAVIISLITITAVTIACSIWYNEISTIRKGRFEFNGNYWNNNETIGNMSIGNL